MDERQKKSSQSFLFRYNWRRLFLAFSREYRETATHTEQRLNESSWLFLLGRRVGRKIAIFTMVGETFSSSLSHQKSRLKVCLIDSNSYQSIIIIARILSLVVFLVAHRNIEYFFRLLLSVRSQTRDFASFPYPLWPELNEMKMNEWRWWSLLFFAGFCYLFDGWWRRN